MINKLPQVRSPFIAKSSDQFPKNNHSGYFRKEPLDSFQKGGQRCSLTLISQLQPCSFFFNQLPLQLKQERVCLQCGRPGFDPCVGKISWRRKWQPTPVFLPGRFRGRRSLAGYSPWGHKELDTTERLTLFFNELINLSVLGLSCSMWDLVP